MTLPNGLNPNPNFILFSCFIFHCLDCDMSIRLVTPICFFLFYCIDRDPLYLGRRSTLRLFFVLFCFLSSIYFSSRPFWACTSPHFLKILIFFLPSLVRPLPPVKVSFLFFLLLFCDSHHFHHPHLLFNS